MDLHQFCKEHYFHEHDRKNQINSALVIPIGIFTVIGGALIALVKSLEVPFNCLEIIILSVVGITSILLISTGYNLIKAYYNYAYGYIATSQELMEYRKKLLQFYTGQPNAAQQADTDLEEYVISEYAAHTHRNVLNNNKKAKYNHNANCFLVAAITALFFASIPYIIISITEGKEPQKIELVKVSKDKEIIMPDDDNSEPQETPSQSEEKPTPPPGRVIRENEEPKETR